MLCSSLQAQGGDNLINECAVSIKGYLVGPLLLCLLVTSELSVCMLAAAWGWARYLWKCDITAVPRENANRLS